jgi:hypothetical protein
MDEMLTGLMSMLPLDNLTASLGIDAGMVGAVHEGTNRVKEYLETVSWDDHFARLYPFIPLAVAFPLAWLNAGMPLSLSGMGSVLLKAGIYWVMATQGWNIYKKTFKGE